MLVIQAGWRSLKNLDLDPDPTLHFTYSSFFLGPGNTFHAIRLTRIVFEQFFKKFETIYMFEGQTNDQINRKSGEVGFYFIGKKI